MGLFLNSLKNTFLGPGDNRLLRLISLQNIDKKSLLRMRESYIENRLSSLIPLSPEDNKYQSFLLLSDDIEKEEELLQELHRISGKNVLV